MDGKIVALILVGVAVFSAIRVVSQWRGMSRKRRHIDWDEHFIQSLRKTGVNTFEEHTVDFFFTLPSRAAAEQLAHQLRPEGYEMDIREDQESGRFSLHGQRNMRLVVAEMQALTARFKELATSHGGTYDNWAVGRK